MIDGYLKFERSLTRLIHNLSAILLLISVSLTFFQVVTRFVFDDPSTWSEVMSRSLMIWAVFLGAAAAFRFGAMISVEVVFRLVPRGRQIWLHTLITALILIFLTILGWFGFQMTLRVQHQEAALIYVSMSWFYAALPVGAVFCILSVIARYIELFRKWRDFQDGRGEAPEEEEHPEYAL